MDNMTRLYREDYPDGLLFLPNEINVAKAQGWRNNIEDIIVKPVPELKDKPGGKLQETPHIKEKSTNLVEKPQKEGNFNEKPPGKLCACGCGRETKKLKGNKGYQKYFSHNCYWIHRRDKKLWRQLEQYPT